MPRADEAQYGARLKEHIAPSNKKHLRSDRPVGGRSSP